MKAVRHVHGKPIQLEISLSQNWCFQSHLPRFAKQISFEISMCLGNTTSFMFMENQFNWKAVNLKTGVFNVFSQDPQNKSHLKSVCVWARKTNSIGNQ